MRPTPVQNIVSEITLGSDDVFLPIFEAVVNSIISINLRFPKSAKDGSIKIEIYRSEPKDGLGEFGSIKSVTITDNGIGFTKQNVESFETPHSHTYKNLGCKGMGRFTCIAAFHSLHVESHYYEDGSWQTLCFSFDPLNEIKYHNGVPIKEENETVVRLQNYKSVLLEDASKVPAQSFANVLMNHCLIYYLDEKLPHISVIDHSNNEEINVNLLYASLSAENERTFLVKGQEFKAYILKTKRSGNRKNHYVHYCANSREVGNGKNLSAFNSIFQYPIYIIGTEYFLDIYVVSDFLDSKAYVSRNGFFISNGLFEDTNAITFADIENEIAKVLQDQFHEHYQQAQEKAVEKVQDFIRTKGVEYRRFLERKDILKTIPPTSDPKIIDEHLHKIAYLERQKISEKMDSYINAKTIDENTISNLAADLKQKTAFDADSLADYMCRRKAILVLLDRLLEADRDGKYKLENDIHKIVMPLGLSGDPIQEAHNLWLLDERFVTYSFVASDITLSKVTSQKSTLEPDVLLWNEGVNILDKPTAYGSAPSGELDSLVVFEFKRPGETAHQKRKTDNMWEFSELVEKYFDAFLYGNTKKNYKGRPVVVDKSTSKFGYVILDVISPQLKEFNLNKGYKKTPYGTYYKIVPEINLHIEVITFGQLIEHAHKRHKPFFDKLFVA